MGRRAYCRRRPLVTNISSWRSWAGVRGRLQALRSQRVLGRETTSCTSRRGRDDVRRGRVGLPGGTFWSCFTTVRRGWPPSTADRRSVVRGSRSGALQGTRAVGPSIHGLLFRSAEPSTKVARRFFRAMGCPGQPPRNAALAWISPLQLRSALPVGETQRLEMNSTPIRANPSPIRTDSRRCFQLSYPLGAFGLVAEKPLQ